MNRQIPINELIHFINCEGCYHCDYLLELYGVCYKCNDMIDKRYLNYYNSSGNYVCDSCNTTDKLLFKI